MSNIISFPGPTKGCGGWDAAGHEALVKAKLITFCSFHHLKISLLELGRNPNFSIAADAIPIIDWATEELHHVSVPSEQNFFRLKLLAKVVNHVGAYVALSCGWGSGQPDIGDTTSSS